MRVRLISTQVKWRRRDDANHTARDADDGRRSGSQHRSRAQIDFGAFSEEPIKVVIWDKDVFDRVRNASGRRLTGGDMNGYMRRRRSKRQRRIIGKAHRLKENVNRAVDIGRLGTMYVCDLYASRGTGRRNRDAAQYKRIF